MDLQYHKINVGQLKQVQKNSMVLKMPKTKSSLLTDNDKFPDLTIGGPKIRGFFPGFFSI